MHCFAQRLHSPGVRTFAHALTRYTCLLFTLCLLTATLFGESQATSATSNDRKTTNGGRGNETIPALFISDIHFDPFHDPGKVDDLVRMPVSQWKGILLAPASLDNSQRFEALQKTCQARGVDTPYSLLESSLQAMRAEQSDAKFITISGDLIAHAFSCRYKTLLPASTPADYEAFVLKTISFVLLELRQSLPGSTVYTALGNNDSPCGDYRLDADSDFLSKASLIIAEGLPREQRQHVVEQYSHQGYFSLMMNTPMQHTRLIVLNDIFMSSRYKGCDGKPHDQAAIDQLTWLESQLEQVKQLHQTAWVMGHIPPGVDAYSTVARLRDICGSEKPVMFLSSDALADTLVRNGDVVRLGLFAHTHMDEMRLLPSGMAVGSTSIEHSVAIKLVPSISPVDGNNPSFTEARINPSTAMLTDYAVIAASNQTGLNTKWSEEYEYSKTYYQSTFSPAALEKLVSGFNADPKAATEPSKAYLRSYFVGDRSQQLALLWPQYLCAVSNTSADAFTQCACSAGK